MRLLTLLLKKKDIDGLLDAAENSWIADASEDLISMVEGGTEIGHQLFGNCVTVIIDERVKTAVEESVTKHLVELKPSHGADWNLDRIDDVRGKILKDAMQTPGAQGKLCTHTL